MGWRMKNFNILDIHWKIQGEFTKSWYREGLPKKETWRVCWFDGRFGKKDGVLILRCTLWLLELRSRFLLDYSSSFLFYKPLVLLKSWTKDRVMNSAIIIPTIYVNIDTVVSLTAWSQVITCKKVSYYIARCSIGYFFP